MKLALSIPDSEERNPIKGGRDRGCKGLGGDVNSQPGRLKREKTGERKESKWSWTNMKLKEDAGGF